MTFTVNDIRSKLVYGGWRPSHFQVIITNPFDPGSDQDLPFTVRAAQMPGDTIGKIPVYYFGRPFFVPGDRQIEDWTTTVINDEDFKIRNALEKWSNAMNARKRNVASVAEVNQLKSTGIIRSFGKDGRLLREVELEGLFPYQIAPIETDWGITDQIAEFQVTWSYDGVEVIGGETGDGGGS